LALEAASTSSKIVDDATKEAIGTKANCIRDMRKEILHLKKQVRDNKGLERQVSRLNSDIVALVKEKSEWKSLHQNVTKEVKLLNKKVNDQTDAKYAHQQKMAEIALKGKQATLTQGQQNILHLEAKNKEALQQRKEFQTWTYAQRGLQKDKELQRKEEIKEKKSKKVAERLQVVSSDMLRTNRINRAAFPNPGLSLQIICLDVEIICLTFFFHLACASPLGFRPAHCQCYYYWRTSGSYYYCSSTATN
jgi:hypothetical protein